MLTKRTDIGLTWPFQDMPTPNQELTVEEYFKLAHCSPWGQIKGTEYEQWPFEGPTMWEVHIYWFPAYGIAVLKYYGNLTKKYPHTQIPNVGKGIVLGDNGNMTYGYLLRFFKLGCEHEYGPDEGRYMFDHQFTCKKCGYHMGYDSSG